MTDALNFVEGCMIVPNSRLAEESGLILVSFLCSLDNFVGNSFAMLDNKDAEKAERKHNRAVDEE